MITAKVVSLTGEYRFDKEQFDKLDAELGDEYEVGAISIGQSSSKVQLKNGGFYNTVYFEFYEDGVKFDIFKDKRFNCYLGLYGESECSQ